MTFRPPRLPIPSTCESVSIMIHFFFPHIFFARGRPPFVGPSYHSLFIIIDTLFADTSIFFERSFPLPPPVPHLRPFFSRDTIYIFTAVKTETDIRLYLYPYTRPPGRTNHHYTDYVRYSKRTIYVQVYYCIVHIVHLQTPIHVCV